MSSSPPGTTDPDEALRIQAVRLLDGEALGRSRSLQRLFSFLLACSLEGRAPKELEIAEEVFGRSAERAGEQDASIRVHVHRLRRKLDEHYAGAGAGEPLRLTIPRGGYRLAVEPLGAAPPPPAPLPAAPRPRRQARALLAVAALLVAAVVFTWWLARRPDPLEAPLRAVRGSALWQPVLANGRRVGIVVGDYYIFGERGANGDVARLIREFSVNSGADLDRLIAARPERAERYVDLGLDYLPLGIGNALRVVAPVLRRSNEALLSALVVPASQISPEMVKLANLVYLGYFSALGPLRDPVFGNSRFAVGGSYDEIVDRRTGRTYTGGTHLERNGNGPTRDYALISSFAGVSGNRVVVIAGTRDAALMQAADFATRPETLDRLMKAVGNSPAFEALLSVDSLDRVGLQARLIVAAPRPLEADWSGRQTQVFPDEDPAARP